jgi:hypothetical protein
MKRMAMWRILVVFTALILALFVSCEDGAKEYSVDVINSSSKTVTYTYDGNANTLPPSGSRTYHVEANTPPPKDIITENSIISVKLIIHSPGGKYEIVDVPSIPLHIFNSLPVDVRITASGYLEDNTGFSFVECPESTAPGTPSETIAKIYTNTPVFSSVPEYEGRQEYPYYPVTFEWDIKSKPETDEQYMYLFLK